MPRPTIDYLNQRRAAKAASGGTNYRARETAKCDPAVWPTDRIRSRLVDLSLIAEALRARAAKLPRYTEPQTEIPF